MMSSNICQLFERGRRYTGDLSKAGIYAGAASLLNPAAGSIWERTSSTPNMQTSAAHE